MKYTFGFFLATIFLLTTNGLLGQKTSPRYKIGFTDTDYFTLTVDSINSNISNNSTIILHRKDSVIVMDSFNITRCPIEFSDVYIIRFSKALPKITESTKNKHNLYIYYFDQKLKKLFPFNKNSKVYLKSEGKTRKELVEMIRNSRNKKPTLIIYSSEDNIVNPIKLLKTFFDKLPLLYAVVNTNAEYKTKICEILPKECFWDSTLKNDININRLENYYYNFSKIECRLSYNKLPSKISDTLIINDRGSTIKVPFTVTPPDSKESNYIINANKQIKDKEYVKAFNYISDKSKKIESGEIIAFYKENFNSGLEQAYKNRKLAEYFSYSENNWKIDTISDISYHSLKEEYLKKMYKQLNGANSDNKLKLIYLEEIVALGPQSDSYKIELLNLKGDVALEHNKYSEAIDWYVKSYQVSNSEYRLKKIEKAFVLTTKNYCAKKSRSYLWKNYKLFEKNKKYWKNNYLLNYYAACTYYKLAFYRKASSCYLWMRHHFHDTNNQNKRLISLEEIDNKIYNLLLKTGKYYKSCKASQTLCYDSKDANTVYSEMQIYLASYKGAWFNVLSDAIKVYLNNGNTVDKLISNIQHNNTGLLSNSKIESILIYYPSKSLQKALKGKKNNTLSKKLFHLNSFPVVTNKLTEDKNLYFLVDRSGKSNISPLVVISFRSISPDNNEMELIRFLQNKKDITNTWTEINDFEQKSLEKTVVPWLAAIIQADKTSPKASISRYWSTLKKHTFIKYILIFDMKGNEFFNRGFNPTSYNIDKMMWEKSKTTPLFLRQQLKTKSDNQLYINDISVPVKINNSKKVLKLGISQLCN
jgi:hypothetical protein